MTRIDRQLRPASVHAGWVSSVLVTTLALVLGLPLVNREEQARAGHTLAGGDCWQVGTPLLCRTTWTSSTRIVNLNLYNQFTDVRPGWYVNAEAACNNWHNYIPSTPTNDIWCHWAPSGASAVYLPTATNGTHDLADGVYAVTWNCNTSGVCFDTNTALNIWYSVVYLNTSGAMDGVSSDVRTKIFAHELGHTLGLFHHQVAGYLMRQGPYTTSGPTAGDYGLLPACSGASTTWGVRCIYHFNQ